MSFRNFHTWLLQEKADIFGFDREERWERADPKETDPIKQLNVEKMMHYLKLHDIGTKTGDVKFLNEIHWGQGPGAIRVWMGTGLNLMIEKLNYDLGGRLKWITKKVFQIDQSGYGGFEDAVANEILDQVKKIDEQPIDSPARDFKDLEDLTIAIASKVKRTARPIFMFEGIRKVDRNTYIIRLGVRGHGVEAQGQQRVLENQTLCHYDEESGLIRITNYNLESAVGKAAGFEIQASDTDWNFSPNQSRDEIVETLANTMHWY